MNGAQICGALVLKSVVVSGKFLNFFDFIGR